MVGRLGLHRWAPGPGRRPLLALPQVALQAQQPGQVQEVALAEQADVAGAQRECQPPLRLPRLLSSLCQHLPLPGVAPLRPRRQQRPQLLLTCGRAEGRRSGVAVRAVLAGAPMALSRGGEEGSWPGTKPESCARCPAAASVDAPFFAPASPTRIKSSTSSSGGAGTHLAQGFRHWSPMRRANVVRRHSNGSQVAPGAVAAVVRIRAREREAWEDGPNARGPNTRAARAARALRLSHVRVSHPSGGAGASTRRKGGVRLAGEPPKCQVTGQGLQSRATGHRRALVRANGIL